MSAASVAPGVEVITTWGDVVLDVRYLDDVALRRGDFPALVRFDPARRHLVLVGDEVQALPLVLGARAFVPFGPLSLSAQVVEPVARIERRRLRRPNAAELRSSAASLAAHAMLLASCLVAAPALGATVQDAEAARDQQVLLQALLDAAAEREAETPDTKQYGDDPRSEHGDKPFPGGTGARARGEEGATARLPETRTARAFTVRRENDVRDPQTARLLALRKVVSFGMIGLVPVDTGADPRSPQTRWGDLRSRADDAVTAEGSMWGAAVGQGIGTGGLGLSGAGEGGGGMTESIGLGSIGAFGHGIGTGSGHAIGTGHMMGAPGIREGETSVNGRLPPEAVQRIVRQNFGRFRGCYEAGLQSNPSLSGRVTTRFVVDRSGAVALADATEDSDLPDAGVRACVARAFMSLSFPAPEGGMVTVVYPIVFSPIGVVTTG